MLLTSKLISWSLILISLSLLCQAQKSLPYFSDQAAIGMFIITNHLFYWVNKSAFAVSRTQQNRQKERSVKTLHFAPTPKRTNVNIKLNKYFVSSSGNRTYNKLRLQLHISCATTGLDYYLMIWWWFFFQYIVIIF